MYYTKRQIARQVNFYSNLRIVEQISFPNGAQVDWKDRGLIVVFMEKSFAKRPKIVSVRTSRSRFVAPELRMIFLFPGMHSNLPINRKSRMY